MPATSKAGRASLSKPGTLTNDFFVNLLDMEHAMAARRLRRHRARAATARPNAVKWTATRVDLIFGSHAQLRAFAEVYAALRTAKEKFAKDFVAAWTKVMNHDRFEALDP